MPNTMYAEGRRAWGRCQRCSLRYLLNDLVFDGYMPNLRVCLNCWDDKHPQEFLQDVTDPEALWMPTPDDPPFGSVITAVSSGSANAVTWTPADPVGGPSIASYNLYRSLSSDGGRTFTAPALAFSGAVVYQDALSLDGSTFGASNTGVAAGQDNNGIVSQPLAYSDTAVIHGYLYSYQVIAITTRGRGIPSNAATVVH